MRTPCIGEPISWLRIERYVLEELQPVEAGEVERHLEACEACRASLAEARTPRALPPLLELVKPPVQAPRRLVSPLAKRRAVGAFGAAIAVAAAALFMISPLAPSDEAAHRDALHIRGGDVQMTVLRERRGLIAENPAGFDPRDRWKILLTCPPDQAASFSLWLQQDGETSPLPLRAEGLRCGNRVAVPGAFRITGSSEATICVTWGSAGSPTDTRDRDLSESVCHRLSPAESEER